jgi:TetR/AcrR family transcriptional repressor of nem operon
MIEQGQAAAEIPAHVEPVDTARGLLSLFIGLRVLARSRPEKSLLRSVANQAAALLS